MPTRFDPRERLLGSPFGANVAQWLRRGAVKSIQAGSVTAASAATATAAINTVDPANTILIWGGATDSAVGPNPSVSYVRITLTDSVTITMTTTASATNVARFTAIEFWPGFLKSIQRNAAFSNSGTTATDTITAVDVTRSWVSHLGFTTNVSDDKSIGRIDLTNATTVTQTRAAGASGTTTMSYEVVETY